MHNFSPQIPLYIRTVPHKKTSPESVFRQKPYKIASPPIIFSNISLYSRSMDILPPETKEPENNYTYPDEFYALLSEEANQHRKYNRLPNKVQRKTRFLDSLQEAFELCGGSPRLASWADKNYGQFVKAFSKTLPAAAAQVQINSRGPIQIISAIPSTALDTLPEPINVTPPQPLIAAPVEESTSNGE